LNAWFDGHAGRRHVLEKIDLGIAVDLQDGLFVPVLRNVAHRDAADLRAGLDRMRRFPLVEVGAAAGGGAA